MNLPEPVTKQFSSLMVEISDGKLKIPQFQRDFVWDIKKSAGLLDSVIKGYPVGSFIFWKTRERLRSVRNIGNLNLPEPTAGDYVNFVLDGQQRITSLFAALKGETIERESGKKEDFSEIFIDLEAKEEDGEKIVTTETDGKEDGQLIKLTDLLHGGITFLNRYPQKYHGKLENYKNRITSYNYSIIQVDEAPIDVASEIFTRVNVGGRPLSVFEIMVAKTYDYDKNFDLAEKFDALIDSLRVLNYETLSNATVLQLAALLIKKECKRKTILDLDKEKFIELWDSVANSVQNAAEYLRNCYRIEVSRLLPYNALIVPFAYFFYHHEDRPTGDKQKYLEDFFWRVSLSGRYSSSLESKLAQDIKRIDKILKGEIPKYDWPISVSPEFIKDNGWFSAGRSYIKAILCIYAYHQPESFVDRARVTIGNDWLKQANSKNYHHFFPKAYLRGLNEDERKINNILNITIVDDFLNKRQIRHKPPSEYMTRFRETNPNLDQTMKTHLIGDLDKFGVWTDDYHKFFEERAKVVSREIKKRIIKQDVDENPQAHLADDSVEEGEEEYS